MCNAVREIVTKVSLLPQISKSTGDFSHERRLGINVGFVSHVIDCLALDADLRPRRGGSLKALGSILTVMASTMSESSADRASAGISPT